MDRFSEFKQYEQQLLHAAASVRVQWKRRYAEIEALTQEAVSRLLEKPMLDLCKSKFVPYIKRLVTNLVVDGLRRNGSHQRYLESAGRERTESGEPLMQLLADEERQQLRDAIGRLPSRQRQIMTLYVEGYEREELAQRLGMEKGTVNVVIWRATRRIRQWLAA